MPAPPKPWERAGSSASRSSPLGGSSADDGKPKPWETQSTVVAGDAVAAGQAVAPVVRPWDRAGGAQLNGSMQPAYGMQNLQMTPYDSPYSSMPSTSYGTGAYGAGTYGRPWAAGGGSMYGNAGAYGSSGMYGNRYSGMVGGGMYGSSQYGAGSMYGSGTYGGGVYGGGGYGSSMYSGGGLYGGGMPGAYGRPGLLGPYGGAGLYDTREGIAPGQGMPGLPGAPEGLATALHTTQTRWQTFMNGINHLMHFFGRVSFLMDENAHAVHFFITALLQLLDRASFLYGEIARFILRLLGYKGVKKAAEAAAQGPPGALPLLADRPPAEAFESAWPGRT